MSTALSERPSEPGGIHFCISLAFGESRQSVLPLLRFRLENLLFRRHGGGGGGGGTEGKGWIHMTDPLIPAARIVKRFVQAVWLQSW